MQSIFGAGGFAGQALSQFGSSIMNSLPSLVGAASDIYGMWDSNRRYESQLKQQAYANNFAERQFQETQKYNEWNKYLSQNGVQIRANDLARAGLSKVLASGSTPSYVTGSAGGSVSTVGFGQGFKATALMEALQMQKNFQRQDAEISLLKAQRQNVIDQNEGIKLDNVHKQLENEWDEYSNTYWKNVQSHPQSNAWIKLMSEALGMRGLPARSASSIADFIVSTFGTFKSFYDWISTTPFTESAINLISSGFSVSKERAKNFINNFKLYSKNSTKSNQVQQTLNNTDSFWNYWKQSHNMAMDKIKKNTKTFWGKFFGYVPYDEQMDW